MSAIHRAVFRNSLECAGACFLGERIGSMNSTPVVDYTSQRTSFKERLSAASCYRISEIEVLVGLSRSAIYARIRAKDKNGEPAPNRFPAPRKLGGKCSRWERAGVDRWIDEHIRGESI